MNINVDEELRSYSKHLYYEVSMMQECLVLMEKYRDDEEQLKFALLESFLIHVRVIWDFIYRYKRFDSGNRLQARNRDDVIAEDYFDAPDQWQPDDSQLLSRVCTAINKTLAHLTEARLTAQQWECSKIHDAIVPYLSRFRNSVLPGRLCPELLHVDLSRSWERILFSHDVVTTTPDFRVTAITSNGTRNKSK